MNKNMEILDFIFPRLCHICGVPIPEEQGSLCAVCKSRLPRTRYHAMPMNQMEHRFAGRFPFERATGLLFYSSDSDLSILVHDFKYHRFRKLARELGGMMGEELFTTGFLSDVDVIVPIPIHFLKKALRGYNQTEELARGLSEVTGIPVNTSLRAARHHRTQTSLSREARQKNTQGIFRIKGDSLRGKHILLLDDICTTGATLTAAADVIHATIPNARLTLLTLGVTI